MKRGIFLVLGVFLVLSLSFTSAGLFDFLKKKEIVTITGDAITGNVVWNTPSECQAGTYAYPRDMVGNKIFHYSRWGEDYIYAESFCSNLKGCEGYKDVKTIDDNDKACRCDSSWGCEGESCSTAYLTIESVTCYDPNAVTSCYDSDGENYYNKGYVEDGRNVLNDTCESKDYVLEWSCDNNGLAQDKSVFCENGCLDGACLKRQIIEQTCYDGIQNQDEFMIDCGGVCKPCVKEPELSCYDSDGGKNYSFRGTIEGNLLTNGEKPVDYCVRYSESGETLVEYYCENGLRSESYECPSEGKVCVEGACVEVTVEGECYDSDGENTTNQGYVKHVSSVFQPDPSYFELIDDSSGILFLADSYEVKVKEGEIYNYRGVEFFVTRIEPNFYNTGEDMVELKTLGMRDNCFSDDYLIEGSCVSGEANAGHLEEISTLLFISSERINQGIANVFSYCENGCNSGRCLEESLSSCEGLTGWEYASCYCDIVIPEGVASMPLCQEANSCYGLSCDIEGCQGKIGCVPGEQKSYCEPIGEYWNTKEGKRCYLYKDEIFETSFGGDKFYFDLEEIYSDNVNLNIQSFFRDMKSFKFLVGETYNLNPDYELQFSLTGVADDLSYIIFEAKDLEEQRSYCSLGELVTKKCYYEGINYVVTRETECNFKFDYLDETEKINFEPLSTYELENGIKVTNKQSSCLDNEIVVYFNGEGEKEVTECDSGCMIDNKCVPVCYRNGGEYCSISGDLVTQLSEGESCDNSCECDSNVCAGGECVSGNMIQKVINFFKRIFGVQANDYEKEDLVEVDEPTGEETETTRREIPISEEINLEDRLEKERVLSNQDDSGCAFLDGENKFISKSEWNSIAGNYESASFTQYLNEDECLSGKKLFIEEDISKSVNEKLADYGNRIVCGCIKGPSSYGFTRSCGLGYSYQIRGYVTGCDSCCGQGT